MSKVMKSIGRVMPAVLILSGLSVLIASLAIPACTGAEILGGSRAVKTASPLVPVPGAGIVVAAADEFDARVAAYLEAHPEKLNTKWGIEEWATVLGIGVFGGGVRRKASELLVKSAKKTLGPDEGPSVT
jgi:hypothetical protein